MKTVCAWCGRVLKEGSGEKVSHVICSECFEREGKPFIENQHQTARRRCEDFIAHHDGKCRGSFDFVGEQLLMGFAIFMIFFLVLMAAEGLHYLTGGKVPELIEWQPKNSSGSSLPWRLITPAELRGGAILVVALELAPHIPQILLAVADGAGKVAVPFPDRHTRS